jgi:hypothetical protein
MLVDSLRSSLLSVSSRLLILLRAEPLEPVQVVYIDHPPEPVAGTGRLPVPNRFSVVLGTGAHDPTLIKLVRRGSCSDLGDDVENVVG